MLFIALGLIILLTSFLAALVMLIRELAQRSNIEDSINDFSLEFADELIPVESGTFDSVIKSQDQPENILPPEVKVSNPPSLDEVVPFPWETVAQSQLINQADQARLLQEEEKISASPVPKLEFEQSSRSFDIVPIKSNQDLSRDNLLGDFSVRDLAEKIE